MAKSNDEDSLIEDQKKFRKYRKLLRQIEHLQLLNRPLNDEEKAKVSKRAYYREQLDKLNAFYSNNKLAYREGSELNTTGDSGDHVDETNDVDQGDNREQDESQDEASREEEEQEQDQDSEDEDADEPQTVQTEPKKAACTTQDIDEICSRMESMTVPESEPPKVPKPETKQPKLAAQKPKSLKFRTFFNDLNVKDAHEDLIVCLDICVESGLVVTGSRDTTIKAWKLCGETGQQSCQLIQSFGGHSSPITCVKFWPYKYYQQSFANTIKQRDADAETDEEIDDRDYEEAQLKLKQLEERSLDEDHQPFIVSSSLDCTARIWCLKSAMCLKEMYLYNPINRFDISETTIAFGLDAGKIDFWKNLRRAATIKALDDDESICDVKMIAIRNEHQVSKTKKIYSISQNGMVKVYLVNDQGAESNAKVSYQQLHHSDVMDSLSPIAGSNTLSKRTFKSFEILNDTKLALIVQNQSFIVLYDLNNETSKPLSTNVNSYGLTTCFNKVDNQIFINAYDIDHASSAINVFNIASSSSAELNHVCTLQEDKAAADPSTYCMTDLKCQAKKMTEHEKDITVVSCSSRSFKVWQVETRVEKGKEKLVAKNGLHEAKMSKLCSKVSYLSSEASANESEEDEEDDSDASEDAEGQANQDQANEEHAETKKSSRCSIQ